MGALSSASASAFALAFAYFLSLQKSTTQMYPALLHSHSGLRWFVILFMLLVIIKAFGDRSPNNALSASGKRFSLFALIFTHLQIVLGLILYFISPKVQFSSETMGNTMLRFYTVEHIFGMLIVAILVTLGNRHAKSGNARKTFTFYLIAFIILLASIPWPFRAALGGSWF